MDQVKTIVDELVMAYKEITCCRSIALIGSRARGDARQWSDIDIMTVCFTEPDIRDRTQIAKNLADADSKILCKDEPFMSDSFKKGGFPINVWHITQDIICDRVGSIEKRRRLESTFIICSLSESLILWDPKRQLTIWKNTISPIPEDYKQKVIPQIFAEITNVIEDLALLKDEQNTFYVQHEIIVALESHYELLFLLNGQYLTFSHRVESIFSTLQMLPDGFKNKVLDMLICPSDARGLRLRWRILSELTKTVGDFLRSKKYDINVGWDQLKNCAPFLFKL